MPDDSLRVIFAHRTSLCHMNSTGVRWGGAIVTLIQTYVRLWYHRVCFGR